MPAPGHMERSESGHPSPDRGQVSVGRLWFGVFGAPVAWSVQTLVNYGLASYACFPALAPLREPLYAGLWWILLLVGLAALAVEIAAIRVAWESWRRTRNETGGGHHHALESGEGRTRFMALAGLMSGALLLLVSLVQVANLFLVQPCGA
jgi:hypothetical protein